MKRTGKIFPALFFASIFQLPISNGFSQNFPSQNIELLSKWNDSTVASEPVYGIKYQGVFGWANPQDGREYAIIGSTAGTYFVEVTNPAQPELRAYVAGRRDSCIWREIHTYSNFCYIVSDDASPNSFQIVDMSYLPDTVVVVHDSTNVMSRCHTIFVDRNKLYGGIPKGPFGQSSMAVFSLNNPAEPVLLRRIEQDFSGLDATHDMFARNDTIYASMSNSGYFVFRYDSVQNKFFQLGSLTQYPYQGYNHSSSLTANGKYTVMCDEVPAGLQVKVVDVTDLSDITVVTTFQSNTGATPHNPYVVGNNRAVIAYYQDGVQIFDISTPSNPVRSGYFDTRPEHGDNDGYPDPAYQGCWGAYPYLPSGIILASDMQNGLFVLDASVALGTSDFRLPTSDLHVYPNPSNGIFEVQSINYEGRSIKIYNMFGEMVFQSAINNWQSAIDISNQPAGIYFYQLSNGEKTYGGKLVKE